MTPTIHITEHGRAWHAEEIAALGEVFTSDAPMHDLQHALEQRGYRVLSVGMVGMELSAGVEHDVPAVTAENVTDEQIAELRSTYIACFEHGADAKSDRELFHVCMSAVSSLCHETRRSEARRRCAAAINARRGAP
jgi:hypothetical protein